ncbi:hypothetical protein GP486_002544 [Trichoglossum hirsutum]|uniref:NACHT domain-containing protein n=1 Tax=Trichoglossum hirsutum TaxID=265104 RepID=A0A9P8LEV6_9PEZI|nr:hypothetical protein GP486_002544 [Trichoglossum hirsutum]
MNKWVDSADPVIDADSSQAKEKKKCLHALFVTDPTDDRAKYISFRGRPVARTCTWLTENQTYKTWVDPQTQSALIWISGGPGTGKTMLSIFLTEELEKMRSAKAILLYYFCENRDAKRNSAVNVLRGLIFSLIRQRPNLIKCLLPDFEVQEQALFGPNSIEALWRIIENMIKDPETGPVYCVIDGLDECSQTSLEQLEHVLKKIRIFYADHARNMQGQGIGGVESAAEGLRNISLSSEKPPGKSADPVHDLPIFKMALVSREQPQCLLAELSDFPHVQLGKATRREPRTELEGHASTSNTPSTDVTVDSSASTATGATTLQNTGGAPVDTTGKTATEGPPVTISDTADHSRSQKQQNQVAENYEESLSIYIQARINELADSKGYDDTWRSSLSEAILQRGNGTFLWVDLAFNQLTRNESRDFQQALSNLPDGLEDMYCRILLQIPPERIPITAFLMRWITIAFRPLKLEELNVVLRFLNGQPNGPTLDILNDAIESCGDLMTINEDQEVGLLHETTKDFLTRDTSPLLYDPRLQHFYVRERDAHAEIAYACLAYLEGGCLTDGPVHLASGSSTIFTVTKWEPDHDRMERFPFLSYAALNWPEHLRRGYPAPVDLSSTFFSSGSIVRKNWWGTIWESITGSEYTGAPSLFSLLHIAAFFDLRVVAEQLAQRGDIETRVNKKDNGFQTPLWTAGSRGSVDVFNFLLDHGAKQVLLNEHILQLASRRGQLGIAKILLDRGTNVNVVETEAAASKGARAVLRHTPKLLDVLIKASEEEDKGFLQLYHHDCGGELSALHCAASGGHEPLVKFLLERGADVRQSSTQGWTAIHFAAWGGQATLIQLILSAGANARAVTKENWTALHCAAYLGKLAAVEFFLNLGLPIEAVSSQRKTPLHLASAEGHEQTAEMLLDRGANVEAVDIKGLTALHLAAMGGRKPVVKLLLERGANRDVLSRSGETPLKVAKDGRTSEVGTLLATYKPSTVLPQPTPLSPLSPGSFQFSKIGSPNTSSLGGHSSPGHSPFMAYTTPPLSYASPPPPAQASSSAPLPASVPGAAPYSHTTTSSNASVMWSPPLSPFMSTPLHGSGTIPAPPPASQHPQNLTQQQRQGPPPSQPQAYAQPAPPTQNIPQVQQQPSYSSAIPAPPPPQQPPNPSNPTSVSPLPATYASPTSSSGPPNPSYPQPSYSQALPGSPPQMQYSQPPARHASQPQNLQPAFGSPPQIATPPQPPASAPQIPGPHVTSHAYNTHYSPPMQTSQFTLPPPPPWSPQPQAYATQQPQTSYAPFTNNLSHTNQSTSTVYPPPPPSLNSGAGAYPNSSPPPSHASFQSYGNANLHPTSSPAGPQSAYQPLQQGATPQPYWAAPPLPTFQPPPTAPTLKKERSWMNLNPFKG